MIKQFLQIAGVKNEKEFLAKYPTEASFFKAHPEARQLLNQSSGFTPNYADTMPQAMYGMGMALGGSYLPRAADGMQVTDPPRQQDFPDYESYAQAFDQWLASMQQQADTGQALPQGVVNTGAPTTGAPVSVPSPNVSTNKFNLKDYKGVSIVDFLTAQGKPADFSSRKELASALGITNYRGTATQNAQMMQMIQQAPDILSDYDGIAQPTGGVRKTAAKAKNAKGAPSTQEIANAKQEAAQSPSSTQVNTSLQGQTYGNSLAMPNMSNNVIRRDFNTGAWVHVPDPAGMMTVENARRIKLANDMNTREAVEASGQPMFKQGRGYAYGGSWNGTWNGNQGFAVGGSYIPDYAGSAYGLPQFELGAPIYADGGMSPEEAMMMQQQQGAGAPPQAGPQGGGQGQFDQQQVIQAIFQMLQQGMPPEQIMQQLVQGGVPQQIAQQLIQMVMQQVQGGGAGGGQEGMGGGEPNGAQQPQAPAGPEQGMEGQPMPGGMAYGGTLGDDELIGQEHFDDFGRRKKRKLQNKSNPNQMPFNPQAQAMFEANAIAQQQRMRDAKLGAEHYDPQHSFSNTLSQLQSQQAQALMESLQNQRRLKELNQISPNYRMNPYNSNIEMSQPAFRQPYDLDSTYKKSGGSIYQPGWEGEVTMQQLEELRKKGINFDII